MVETPTRAEVQEQKVKQAEEPLNETISNSGFDATGEVFEEDPDYKKKQKKKYTIMGVAGLAIFLLGWFGYYQMTHVKVPDFSNKAISDVRTWASDNKVKVDIEQKHNLKTEVNHVISQNPKATKKIKKKNALKLIVSLGPDPEELIPLPDFSKMDKEEINKWQSEVKAENLTIIEEYDEKVANGKFLKEEFKNKELKREEYTRGDQLIIYLSKGKEVYKKDIAMPNFTGKLKADVEKWAKTNKMSVTYNEVSSDKIEDGQIVSQSIKADEKIAKETKMSVEVSTGKGTKVPNFAELDMESASSVEGLNVQVKQVYTLDIEYGGLVSQSVPAGEVVSQKDGEIIKVVYSIGEPYLKSYYGMSEGELEKAFYEDYRSKGAQINYEKYYMDSSEERGTVVKMSTYNAYVGLNYTVQIGVSNGSGAPAPSPKMNDNQGESDGSLDDVEDQAVNVD